MVVGLGSMLGFSNAALRNGKSGGLNRDLWFAHGFKRCFEKLGIVKENGKVQSVNDYKLPYS